MPLITHHTSPNAGTTSSAVPMQRSAVEDLRSSSSPATSPTGVDTVNPSKSSGSETAASPSTNLHRLLQCGNPRKDVILRATFHRPALGLRDLRFIYRLGSGDIGRVYLVEVKGYSEANFAAKVMDRKELAARNKEGRAKIERSILQMLDHPFLPTLYATFECTRWSCLLTEFCPGGDLHVLRQRQPDRRFHEKAVRFYASEVVVALEYLHMMGIIYRDLKPENVLVRSDGHIMFTDFDLSLKTDSPPSATAQIFSHHQSASATSADTPTFVASSCILPSCIVPAISCFRRSTAAGRSLAAGFRSPPSRS
ncbi:hypothetical protein SAY87_023086 [Trapa incisa]|uniref:non-specific serine/threonine protein kinase n=1 Tax=Trapa incisa TaxID=236973 RepID=A0AAN7KB98_9MYRT|nr:hypothetical protein SAY87_023086 [Trapa incisa]